MPTEDSRGTSGPDLGSLRICSCRGRVCRGRVEERIGEEGLCVEWDVRESGEQ